MKYKKVVGFIFLFIFFLLALCVFGYHNNQFDSIWNYGYSYAISRGQVPYRDFSMVSTPLYSFVMAIGLVFWSNNLMFLIEQALLLTIMFYFLYQLYGVKVILLLLVFCFPLFQALVPTYNTFCLFLLVLLIYAEKHWKNGYVIGVILGLLFCTKQTIGILVFLPTIYYLIKNRGEFCLRFLGFITPVLILVCYLAFQGALWNFIDFCFLGLVDFGSNNSKVFTLWFYLFLVLFIFMIIYTIKHKENIINYYILFASIGLMVPIFAYYHFSAFFFLFMIMFLQNTKIKKKFCYLISIPLLLFSCFYSFFLIGNGKDTGFLSDVFNFNYYLMTSSSRGELDKLFTIYHKYKDQDVIMLGFQNTFLKIAENQDLDLYNCLCRGNYGYHGTEKMINRIKKYKNKIFIINMADYDKAVRDSSHQFDFDIANYVIEHSEKIDAYDYYYVYRME